MYFRMIRYGFIHRLYMATQIQLIKNKLSIWNQQYIAVDMIYGMLKSLKSNYSIDELVRRKIIIPIKQWSIYINMQTTRKIDSVVVGSLYFDWEPYVYWGLALANTYWMTTQVPEWQTIYNTTKLGKKNIVKKYKYIFRKVTESFFYGVQTIQRDGYTIKVMSPERLLIQMIREGASLEFVQVLPKIVDKKKLFIMAKKYTSKRVLSIITQMYG